MEAEIFQFSILHSVFPRCANKHLGNKDGKLTLDDLKAALPKGFDIASLDKDRSDTISGKEITDAIAAAQATAATTTVAADTPARTPAAPVASQARR